MSDIILLPDCTIFHADLIATVSKLIAHVATPEKKGAWLTAIHIPTDVRTLQVPIGEISLKETDKYRNFSEEKPWRILSHPDHVSSHESRNPDIGKWGGAVRNAIWSVGISGLLELDDEAVITAALFHMNLLTMAQTVVIGDRSSNNAIGKLISHVNGPMSDYIEQERP